jgi:hypothetical protein
VSGQVVAAPGDGAGAGRSAVGAEAVEGDVEDAAALVVVDEGG